MRAPRSLPEKGVCSNNHGRSRSDRCLGRTESSDRTISSEPGVDDDKSFSNRAKWRSSPECTPKCAQKTLDAADGFIDVVKGFFPGFQLPNYSLNQLPNRDIAI